MPRSHTMFQDSPPMPLLPSQREEARRPEAVQRPNRGGPHIGDLSGSYASHSPSKFPTSKRAIPGLWSNGSLEKISQVQNGPGSLGHESAIDDFIQPMEERDMWEVQRQAWSLRRRSAGEALLSNHRTKEPSAEVASHDKLVDPSKDKVAAPSHTMPLGQFVYRAGDSAVTAPKAGHSIAHKRIGSGNGSIEAASTAARLTGRYDGGLQYGFEPGYGLGGSAGTRSAQTEASRKSVHVSRGYGIDLSDLPIFVAVAPR